MEKKPNYNIAIDGMRIIAILAVILIHTTTRQLEASSFNILGYPLTFFLNQAGRFAVPLFFLISGFVLELNYPFHRNYLSYLQKRFSRIFLPYLFWSAIYYFFVYTKHNLSFFQSLLTGSASYQLYFIPALLIFYILFPFFHAWYKFISNQWTLIILGLLQIFLLYNTYYIKPFPFLYPAAIAILNYYVFIIGMVAAHHQESLLENIKRWKVVIVSFLILFALIVSLEAKLLYLKTHNYLYFYTQWRPSVLIYTLILADLLYLLLEKSNKYQTFIQALSKLSFFVFFVHVLVLELIWSIFGRNLFLLTQKVPLQEVWFSLLFFFSLAGVSYGAAYVAHKLPFLPKLSG